MTNDEITKRLALVAEAINRKLDEYQLRCHSIDVYMDSNTTSITIDAFNDTERETIKFDLIVGSKPSDYLEEL